MVPTWELTFVLGYLGKSSLDLRTRVRRTIERDLPYCKLNVIFRSKCRLNTLVQFKDSLEKKIRSGILIVICVVTAGLFIEKKPSVTFIPERLNTWEPPLSRENALKTLSSMQYLTISSSLIAS